MLNNYETVFIMTPVLSDVQMKETVEKFTALLKEEGSEIVNEENWGLKKLAYPIQKKASGFYHMIQFNAKPETIAKLELQYRRDEKIVRFLTFKLDKHAVAYAERRINKNKEAKNEQ